MMDKETVSAANFTFWVVLAFIAALLVGGGIWLLTRPAQLNIEREAIQHSNAYIQSKVSRMTDLKAEYLRLDSKANEFSGNESVVASLRAQQKAILDQMWEAYNLIPNDARNSVPQNIREFLNEHPIGE